MSRFNYYVVSYDVTSPVERNRIVKILLGFGFRVQYSVFECRLRKSDRMQLEEQLHAQELKTGFIKIYRLIKPEHNSVIGTPGRYWSDEKSAFMV